jgi:hypothetical protein
MKVYIILAILFALLIGTSLAQNATTGDVNAFKQARITNNRAFLGAG